MSIKKISFLSAVSLAVVGSTVAFAGGPDAMAAPAPAAAPTVCQDLSSMFSPAFYIDADGGYAFQNWGQYINNMPTIFGIASVPGFGITNNGYGGGTAVFDAGFQFFPHISFEFGGIYLPKVTGPQDSTLTGVPGSVANQYNWAVYGAGKFSVAIPHVSGLSFFTKVGPVWRAMSNQGFDAPGISGARSYWTVVYGGGFQYVFSTGNNVPTGFSANLQWLGIPGYSGDSTTSNKVFAAMQPNDNLLVAGLGYQVSL